MTKVGQLGGVAGRWCCDEGMAERGWGGRVQGGTWQIGGVVAKVGSTQVGSQGAGQQCSDLGGARLLQGGAGALAEWQVR